MEESIENKYKININISDVKIKELCKDYLFDLILFLKNCCQMTIGEKDAIFKHDYFKIEKNINNLNEYFIAVKYDEDDEDEDNNQNKDIDDININNNFNSEEGKIISIINQSNNKQKLLNNINQYYFKHFSQRQKKDKPYICLPHGKKFKTEKDYNKHCADMHRYKCEKCDTFFKTKDLLDKHPCDIKNNNNNYIKKNEINKNDEYDKVKKVENDSINFFENEKEEEEEEENKKRNENESNRQIEQLKYLEEQKKEELKYMNFNECLNIEKEENKIKKKLIKEHNKIKKENKKKENKKQEKLKKKKEKNIKKLKEKIKKKVDDLEIKEILIDMDERNKEIKDNIKKERNNDVKLDLDELLNNNNNKYEGEHFIEKK